MKQTPLPIVSGKYFLPNAPELCLKWMPACVVTSTNSIGPDGLVAAEFAVGAVTTAEGRTAEGEGGADDGGGVAVELGSVSTAGLCWQPAARKVATSKRSKLRCDLDPNNPLGKNSVFMQPRARGRFAGNRTTFR